MAKNAQDESSSEQAEPWFSRLLRISVATLPYGFYLNLFAILLLALWASRSLKHAHHACIDPLTRGALVTVSIGMVLSAIAAIHKGEAALQLANFLPFFWLFTILPLLVRGAATPYKLARDLILASIPIHGVAIAEYLAKTDRLPVFFSRSAIIQAWQSAPHIGRAMVMFDHPNAFANYAVVLFGLSLGVLLSRPPGSNQSNRIRQWVWLATVLNLVGLFCSGSRNGILVACSQFFLFILLTKLNRTWLFLGGLSLTAFAFSIVKFGLGKRSIGIFNLTDDPRVGVWKIALDLIGERPWLGWGPGSFKFLYPSRLIDPTYPIVFHTHNLWLLLSTEYGVPVMIGLTVTIGFISYRAMRVICAMPQTFNSSSSPPIAVLSGYGLALLGSIQFSIMDVTFYDARINMVFWVLLAIPYTQSWQDTISMTKLPHLKK